MAVRPVVNSSRVEVLGSMICFQKDRAIGMSRRS